MKFFITTAIDYVNSIPHIGTAYEKIGADVIARFHRLLGDEVLFQMGNDEHSANVQKSAEAKRQSPKEYCDEMRPKFEDIWKKLHISYNQFIQTSDPKQEIAVTTLFEKVFAEDVYQKDYEGWYCDSCEAFYTDKDLEDGLCKNHKVKPKWLKEKNYFFRLKKYQNALLEHIQKHPEFILPEKRRNEMINFIKQGLEDVSISRSTFTWGIPVPNDPRHVMWVWFDALIGYLSLIGFPNDLNKLQKYWPANLQIVGKDIMRFHCTLWPAMLISVGLPLPQTIFGHGFVYLKGEKMSKSLGNVVTPLDILNKYPDFGADALRYYLMRTSSFGNDSDFTWDDFINRYNSDLANGLGNIISRTAGMITRYFNGELIPADLEKDDQKLSEQFNNRFQTTKNFLDPYQSGDMMFHRALETIWSWISELDRYIDTQAPWILAKEKKEERLKEVLTTVCKSLFYISLLLDSFIPETAGKIWEVFGWQEILPFEKVNFSTSWTAQMKIKIHKTNPLFPRIETKP